MVLHASFERKAFILREEDSEVLSLEENMDVLMIKRFPVIEKNPKTYSAHTSIDM